jgi:acyl-CoA reductase-like NAD-dependent aldehyde dehydrogenase
MPGAPGPIEPQRHYIDGEFRPSLGGRTFETLNPATNEVLALAADGRADDVNAAVAARGPRRRHARRADGRARRPLVRVSGLPTTTRDQWHRLAPALVP